MPDPIRFLDILRVLVRHDVGFVVVGGVAGVLEGAPISTFDLDVVFENGPENRARLLAAFEELDARYLDLAGRHIVPDRERVATLALHRLRTRHGVLDALTIIEPGWSYPDVLARSRTYDVDGRGIQVLELEALIESKEATGRDKDRAALPVLKRTLELRRRR